MIRSRRVSVIGLGYVGLPVAAALGAAGIPTIGFDINAARIRELKQGNDRTGEVAAEDLLGVASSLEFSTDSTSLSRADFHIVTVPTPIDRANRPHPWPIQSACHARCFS